MHRIISCLIFSLFSLAWISGQVTEPDSSSSKEGNKKKNISVFGSDDLLNISIRMDLSGFIRKAKRDAAYDGILIFNPGMPDSVTRKVVIKYRGEFRYDNCSFPPMQVNFRKSLHSYSDTGKIKKLKLVTRCRQNSVYDEYTLREFLVYKMFNVLTDTSFRVRLLKITYYDTRKNNKPVEQYGYFIEPVDIVAARTNNVAIKLTALTQNHINQEVIDRIAIFNYMIANWDWSVPGQHNISILKSKDFSNTGPVLALPFDFDLCGVVNAEYSIPADATGLKSARDRKFDGICRDKNIWKDELQEFLSHRDKIYAVINDFQYLNARAKKDIISFLDQFFIQLEKERNIESLIYSFQNNCKKL